MTPKEKFIALLSTQTLAPADALVLLAGDGTHRIAHTADLFARGMAPIIVVTSGDTRREYGSLPSSDLVPHLVALGVPLEAIHAEEQALNTRDEVVRALTLAKEYGWQSLIFVTSPHHQYRAFLTALAAMHEAELDLALKTSPAPLSWFADNLWGRRADLLPQESERIEKYRELGHVASFEDALEYFEAQEKNI
jgi:uncharacterized SAM-binding protein YcdF (DUF218 family)